MTGSRFRMDGRTLLLSGDLSSETLTDFTIPASFDADRVLLDQVTKLDTAGAWFVIRVASQAGDAEITGTTPAQAILIKTVQDNLPWPKPAPPRASLRRSVAALGQTVWQSGRELLGLVSALGRFMAELGRLGLNPKRLRATSLVHHMQTAGLDAVPIVTLMSFLIGIVVAYQGSTQLERFGAELFVVDLIAISVLRELGILLTAIIVAGRSASAFTAAIGVMKMREEVDALRALGLDPETVLVVPRILALILTLPLLGIISNMAGLIGGAMMAWIDLGIAPSAFAERVAAGTGPWHLGVGLVKAPFFALIIGLVGCRNGMRVSGDAESLGRLTSASVVTAIFFVIVVDALFSIFFAMVGV